MKDFIYLYKTESHDYCQIQDQKKLSPLRFLLLFFSGDYILNDTRLLHRVINFYNITFIYNDVINKMLHIGMSLWELNDDIDAPSAHEFPDYVNISNSCNLSYENFMKFACAWSCIKYNRHLFAIIYRNNNDWIDCKGFESQEAMEIFVKNYVSQ